MELERFMLRNIVIREGERVLCLVCRDKEGKVKILCNCSKKQMRVLRKDTTYKKIKKVVESVVIQKAISYFCRRKREFFVILPDPSRIN